MLRAQHFWSSQLVALQTLISSQHDPDDEPVVSSLDPDYFDFDGKCHILGGVFRHVDLISTSDQKESLDKAQLKELLYEEVVSFVPSI